MRADDEFFSFTTPNVGFPYSDYSKMLLVTVQCFVTGPRIILVHSVTKTTVRMLENSGAPFISQEKLPEHMRRAIKDYYAASLRKSLNAMDAMFKLKEPSERIIQ